MQLCSQFFFFFWPITYVKTQMTQNDFGQMHLFTNTLLCAFIKNNLWYIQPIHPWSELTVFHTILTLITTKFYQKEFYTMYNSHWTLNTFYHKKVYYMHLLTLFSLLANIPLQFPHTKVALFVYSLLDNYSSFHMVKAYSSSVCLF